MRGAMCVVAVGLCAGTLGCGGAAMAPTAPVAAMAVTTVGAASLASVSGVVTGAAGIRVVAIGTTVSATTDATGRFSLSVPPGHVTLEIGRQDRIVSAGTVGAGDHVELEIHLSNEAAEIETRDHETANERELEGTVTAVLSSTGFVVGSMTVTIGAATTFTLNDHAGLASDVGVGARVNVKGTTGTTPTSIVASTVRIRIAASQGNSGSGSGNSGGSNGNSGNGNSGGGSGSGGGETKGEEVEATGTVSALEGSCLSIRFTAAALRVVTSAATRFDLGCSAITAGTRVEVKGTRGADGTVTATRVKKP